MRNQMLRCYGRTVRIVRLFSSDHYSTLGVAKTAQLPEIKAKYKSLAKKYHPDVYKGPKETFTKILEAYKVLASPRKRQEYDESLSGAKKDETAQDKSGQEKSASQSEEFYKGENTFDRKGVNIIKAHSDFFSKPVQTDFGDMNIQMDEAVSKFTKRDMQKAQFVEERNETSSLKKFLDKDHGVGFDKTVEETIEVMNNQTEDKRTNRILAQMQARAAQIGAFRILGLLLGLGIVSAFVLGLELRKEKQRKLEELQEQSRQMEVLFQTQEIKRKFVFEWS